MGNNCNLLGGVRMQRGLWIGGRNNAQEWSIQTKGSLECEEVEGTTSINDKWNNNEGICGLCPGAICHTLRGPDKGKLQVTLTFYSYIILDAERQEIQ